jgi:hypothetical protein
MFEFLLIVYILLVFVFPIPMLGLALCLGVAYLLIRKYQLLNHQPAEGKKIIALAFALQSANWFFSLLLSLVMTLGVHFVFIENSYLFLFNLVFCFAISVRWFDFTHRVFRHFINKWLATVGDSSSVFAVCLGFGAGSPVFMDAGYLVPQDSSMSFKGMFFEHAFLPAEIVRLERKSSEKIKIAFSSSPLQADSILIVLKDQFYPFKSRPKRDEIFRLLEKLQIRPEVDLALR